MTEAEKVHYARRKHEAIQRHYAAIRSLRDSRDALLASLVNDDEVGVREVSRRSGVNAMTVSNASKRARNG